MSMRFLNFKSPTSAKRLGLILLMAWALTGCAALGQGRQGPSWRCSPEADAAVAKGDWAQAIALHEKILSQQPTNCLAMYHLGYIWGSQGDRQKETTHYQWALACGYDKDDQLFFNLGMAYGDLNQPQRAVESLKRAVAVNRQNAENYFGLGLVSLAAGQADFAQQAFAQAIALEPRHWEARLALAKIFLDQSSWPDAQSQLEAVLKAEPDNEEAQALWQTLKSRQRLQYEH